MGLALLTEKAPLGAKVEIQPLVGRFCSVSDCCVREKSAANEEWTSGPVLVGEYSEPTPTTTNLEKRYSYLPNRFAPSQMADASGTYFIHSDHLDTPKIITDNTETVVWRIENQAFGESLPDEDPDNNSQAITLNIRFPGQYRDEESGLHYNFFRNYDSTIGRYVERDPIGLKGGVNVHVYAENAPTKNIDVFGLLSQCYWDAINEDRECMKRAESGNRKLH